jgi:antitoxin (DNA-binding transcriptional repressor) of toxin-antitoxin stability system
MSTPQCTCLDQITSEQAEFSCPEVRAGEEIIVRDRKRPIAKIVPFTVDEDDEDAALVAAGWMRKGTGKLPPSFWRTPRPAVPLEVVAVACGRSSC